MSVDAHSIPVGTLCVIDRCVTVPSVNGTRVVVLAHLEPHGSRRGLPMYRVCVRGQLHRAAEDTLTPIYDGGVASGWGNGVWRPKTSKEK